MSEGFFSQHESVKVQLGNFHTENSMRGMELIHSSRQNRSKEASKPETPQNQTKFPRKMQLSQIKDLFTDSTDRQKDTSPADESKEPAIESKSHKDIGEPHAMLNKMNDS